MKERILWLDCLKGFAILLVVLGHCIHTMAGPGETLWGGVLYLIYCFHMPLFFAASGYLYGPRGERFRQSPQGMGGYILSRALALGIPGAVFGLVQGILSFTRQTQGSLAQRLLSAGMEGVAAYWFLPVLMALSALLPLLDALLRREGAVAGLLLFSSLLAGIWHNGAGVFLFYGFCFYGGALLERHPKALEGGPLPVVLAASLFLAGAAVSFFERDGALITDLYLKALLGVPGAYACLWLFRRRKLLTRWKFLARMGRDTLAVYLLHGFCYEGVWALLGLAGWGIPWLGVPLGTAAGILLPMGARALAGKNRLLDFLFSPGPILKKYMCKGGKG